MVVRIVVLGQHLIIVIFDAHVHPISFHQQRRGRRR